MTKIDIKFHITFITFIIITIYCRDMKNEQLVNTNSLNLITRKNLQLTFAKLFVDIYR